MTEPFSLRHSLAWQRRRGLHLHRLRGRASPEPGRSEGGEFRIPKNGAEEYIPMMTPIIPVHPLTGKATIAPITRHMAIVPNSRMKCPRAKCDDSVTAVVGLSAIPCAARIVERTTRAVLARNASGTAAPPTFQPAGSSDVGHYAAFGSP